MATIQVVLDEGLLRDADQAAERQGVNRSALIRSALRDFLRSDRLSALERQDRDGYERVPERVEELAVWEDILEWPAD